MSISVRNLQIGEMIHLSSDWIDTKKSTFLSIPEVAPHFYRVVAVHGALVEARAGAVAGAEYAELTEQAEVLDQRHDDLARALYYLLIAAHHFELGREAGDETRARLIERANRAMFPEQLRAVQASYMAEAGNAAQLESLAINQFADLLEAICIGKDVSALDVAHALGNVGRALGTVENQRSLAAVQAQKETITPAEVRKRMRDWAQVVETLLMNLQLSTAPADSIDALRKPLLDAVEKAAARRREKNAKGKDAQEAPEAPADASTP